MIMEKQARSLRLGVREGKALLTAMGLRLW